MKQVEISDIKIGKRHRQDMGDIAALAQSIQDVGLLHPVVVTPEYKLIAGQRRLRACKALGWSKVAVHIVDLEKIVRGEAAENGQRKDFTPDEAYQILLAIKPIEEALAKERQAAGKGADGSGGRGKKKTSGKISTRFSGGGGRTRDKVGAFAGYSGRTMAKIAAVNEAAEKDPKRFGKLRDEMNKSGKVNPAFAQVNRANKHQKIHDKAQSTTSKIEGSFPLIYADPPWKWGHFGELDQENEAGKGRTPDQHYPTLTYEEIANFKVNGRLVRELAAKDAALFLWCTSANITSALSIVEAWGFVYKAHAVWVKDKKGLGLIFRNQHEVLLYGSRGKMPGPQFQPSSVFTYPRGKHSAKPPEIRSAIEKMYPSFDSATRLELFAREQVKGWSVLGYEAFSEAAE